MKGGRVVTLVRHKKTDWRSQAKRTATKREHIRFHIRKKNYFVAREILSRLTRSARPARNITSLCHKSQWQTRGCDLPSVTCSWSQLPEIIKQRPPNVFVTYNGILRDEILSGFSFGTWENNRSCGWLMAALPLRNWLMAWLQNY